MRINTGAIRPTPPEMDDFLGRHPEIRTSVELANRLASCERRPASVIGLCQQMFTEIDAETTTWFFLRVADSDGLVATDPIAVLRNRLTKLGLAGGRTNETVELALTIRAWNAHRAGSTRTRLQMTRGCARERELPGAALGP